MFIEKVRKVDKARPEIYYPSYTKELNMNTPNNSKSQQFINKAKEVHGDFYGYDKTLFVNTRTKVVITCPEHGDFEQSPRSHLNGVRCAKCAGVGKSDTKSFVKAAKAIHGSKYRYSLVRYKGNKTKVVITCPEHGDFEQVPSSHLKGHGCAECAANYKMTTSSFIKKSEAAHEGKYDYSKANYISATESVVIICPEHGEFLQRAGEHVSGKGCVSCGGSQPYTTETFIAKAKAVHGDKYDYSKVNYVNAKTKVVIICPDHGEFHQQLQTHIDSKAGCPKCAHIVSKAEQSIADTLRANGLEVLQSNRSILGKFELDIVIPEKKIAIEFNGTYWHSEANGKGKEYHRNKTNLANEAGYRLIHIWEDDFTADPDREIKFILNACGLTSKKCIYARKTTIGEVSAAEAVKFLAENHVQGSVGASVKLGTYYGSELVAVTLFSKRNYGYELVRHAASVKVVGGLGKVVKHFHREHQVDIHSFCDISRHDGRSYEAAGFVKSGELKPDYKYVVNGKREHKFGFRLASIKVKYPEVYSPSKSERQMMEEAGVPRIWDCGKTRYIFS